MKKKLMILGGSRYIIPVIKAAHKLGLYVITCDYLPDNIAHKFSDSYYNISILDKEAVLKKAEELKIDGIMSFACDPGVLTAAFVAEKMNLPKAGPYDSICILQNKGKFRKFMAENGFNVPNAKKYSSFGEAVLDIGYFNWPVIVKPTDSAGSKGVSKIDDKQDLEAAVIKALSYSHCEEFIIEDYLEQNGFSSDSDSFSVDGQLVFCSFSSQRFDKDAKNPYTPSAYSWPSSISERHRNELKSEIQRLLKLLKLTTSIYNIETRECVNGKTYIMELSPRGGGNRLSEMIEIVTGVDLISNAVRASVGMKLDSFEPKKSNLNIAEVILHSTIPGNFKDLFIDDCIKKNVLEKDLWIEKGDKIGGFNGANEAIGTLVLKFNSSKELSSVLENLDKYVKVNVDSER